MKQERRKQFFTETSPDLNGNKSQVNNSVQNYGLQTDILIKKGRVLHPCRFCNKVFMIRKTRNLHMRKCSARLADLKIKNNCEQSTKVDHGKPTTVHKINIKQNIVLSHFSGDSPIIFQRGKDVCDGYNTMSNKLDNKSSRFKTEEQRKQVPKSNVIGDMLCRKCLTKFTSSLDLLRHTRECQSYPKIVMTLNEVKQFYKTKDKTKCPICKKPLQTSFQSSFVKHLHTHTNDMKHSCNVCKKMFSRIDHMRAHKKRHVREIKK